MERLPEESLEAILGYLSAADRGRAAVGCSILLASARNADSRLTFCSLATPSRTRCTRGRRRRTNNDNTEYAWILRHIEGPLGRDRWLVASYFLRLTSLVVLDCTGVASDRLLHALFTRFDPNRSPLMKARRLWLNLETQGGCPSSQAQGGGRRGEGPSCNARLVGLLFPPRRRFLPRDTAVATTITTVTMGEGGEATDAAGCGGVASGDTLLSQQIPPLPPPPPRVLRRLAPFTSSSYSSSPSSSLPSSSQSPPSSPPSEPPSSSSSSQPASRSLVWCLPHLKTFVCARSHCLTDQGVLWLSRRPAAVSALELLDLSLCSNVSFDATLMLRFSVAYHRHTHRHSHRHCAEEEEFWKSNEGLKQAARRAMLRAPNDRASDDDTEHQRSLVGGGGGGVGGGGGGVDDGGGDGGGRGGSQLVRQEKKSDKKDGRDKGRDGDDESNENGKNDDDGGDDSDGQGDGGCWLFQDALEVRRLPDWLVGVFETPFSNQDQRTEAFGNEDHTYYADGSFKFGRQAQAEGFVRYVTEADDDEIGEDNGDGDDDVDDGDGDEEWRGGISSSSTSSGHASGGGGGSGQGLTAAVHPREVYTTLQYHDFTPPHHWPEWTRFVYRPQVALLDLGFSSDDLSSGEKTHGEEVNSKRSVLVAQALHGLKAPKGFLAAYSSAYSPLSGRNSVSTDGQGGPSLARLVFPLGVSVFVKKNGDHLPRHPDGGDGGDDDGDSDDGGGGDDRGGGRGGGGGNDGGGAGRTVDSTRVLGGSNGGDGASSDGGAGRRRRQRWDATSAAAAGAVVMISRMQVRPLPSSLPPPPSGSSTRQSSGDIRSMPPPSLVVAAAKLKQRMEASGTLNNLELQQELELLLHTALVSAAGEEAVGAVPQPQDEEEVVQGGQQARQPQDERRVAAAEIRELDDDDDDEAGTSDSDFGGVERHGLGVD